MNRVVVIRRGGSVDGSVLITEEQADGSGLDGHSVAPESPDGMPISLG
jgi:hypothetical protein